MFKQVLSTLLLCNLCLFVQGQNLKTVQYGFGFKATIDINGLGNNFNFTNYNLSLTGGFGLHPFEASFIYPSLHAGVLVYNRGNGGARYDQLFFQSTQIDFFTNLTVTTGFWRDNIDHGSRRVPLYHFGDFTANPLLNPFQHSFGLGTNLIVFFDNYKEKTQTIGFGNILVDRHFQFNMYNDGWYFAKLKLADAYDRYYTGGGQFSWHQDVSYLFDSFELSFMKFTGYEKLTFETSNLLQSDFINFKDDRTIFYSKNRLRFRMNSWKNDLSLHVTAHNTDKDFQDWLHLGGDWTFFPDIFSNEAGLLNEIKRSGIGVSYNYFNINW